MKKKTVLFYTFLIIFIATCVITLLGVVGVLEIKDQVLDEAIEKTEDECRLEREEAARRREIYARKNFKPYIYIKTSETRPKSIGIVAFAGPAVYKCVGLPEEISSWPIERQIREVSKTVKRNYGERNGHSGQFGEITGYIYPNKRTNSDEQTL